MTPSLCFAIGQNIGTRWKKFYVSFIELPTQELKCNFIRHFGDEEHYVEAEENIIGIDPGSAQSAHYVLTFPYMVQ
jgi:hypothetical protein